MSESSENVFDQNEGFFVNFNQDFTSLSIVGKSGFRLFSLSSVDRVDELFCSHNESTKIAECLFSSSLVAVVTAANPNKLQMCHFKKGAQICEHAYPSAIASVKLNRARLIVCLANSIYVHNIRDMKLIHVIRHIAYGLCTLSLHSHLAFPIAAHAGELQIYDAANLRTLLKIKAHESPLAAIDFSSNGMLIATASQKGTVIRVFCVKNGQKVHEFRRGVKRYVLISSLNFSNCGNYVCVSSNTETVHIFKIDAKAVEETERLRSIEQENENETVQNDQQIDGGDMKSTQESQWTMGYITKALTSYFPSNVGDVLCQDRAFATAQLTQSGLRYNCIITKLNKECKLIAACEDGFLYIYNFDEKGGECKLLRAHDLRNPLCGVTEIEMDLNNCDKDVILKNNTLPATIGSYASVLKGRDADRMSESDMCRDLSEAVEYAPRNLLDDMQFPPVNVARAN